MFDRYLCDFVYHQDHRIEITEVIVTDLWDAFEWLEETFLEIHREPSSKPDALRLRKDQEIVATWQTHFDAVL